MRVVGSFKSSWARSEVDRRIALRLARQKLLVSASAPHLHCVLDETALRRHHGGREVMAEQLDALLEFAGYPNITLQVVPFAQGGHVYRLLLLRRTASMVAPLAAGLRVGQAYALAYTAAKRAAGVVDFDDLIREAEKLLLTPGMGEWVRYKLDQQTDHILVDEAQDTNERQWNIVRALAWEYFAGEGAARGPRTIFTVGDYKQAIFGFQGTDPQSFDVARTWFAREAAAVERDFLDLSLDRSFRSAPPILAVVPPGRRVRPSTRRSSRAPAQPSPGVRPSTRPPRRRPSASATESSSSPTARSPKGPRSWAASTC